MSVCQTDNRSQTVLRTIEEVRVVFRWEAIQLKEVAEVIELPVCVSAHCDVLVVWYADIHQRRQLCQCISSLQEWQC